MEGGICTTVTGQFSLPLNHEFATRVPRQGASCASCRYLFRSMGSYGCKNAYYQDWQRSAGADEGVLGLLPERPDEYCCDVWADS